MRSNGIPRRIDRLEGMTKAGRCDHCRDWPNPHTTWEKVHEGQTPRGVSTTTLACPVCGWQPGHVHILVELTTAASGNGSEEGG